MCMKALCMSCRVNKKPTMQEMVDPKVTEKKNRYSARGVCKKCGKNVFKFLSKEDAKKLM